MADPVTSFGGTLSKLVTSLNPFNWLKALLPKSLQETVEKRSFGLGVGTGMSMLAVSFIFNLIWLLKPLPYLHERVAAAGCDFVGKGIIANELWNNVFSARMLSWIVFAIQILFMIGYFAAEKSADGGFKAPVTFLSVVVGLGMVSSVGMLSQVAFHNTAARAFDDTVGCTGSWKGSAGQGVLAIIFIVAVCGFYVFTFTFYPSSGNPSFNPAIGVRNLSRMFMHYIGVLFAVAAFILAVFIAAKTSVSVDDNIKACMVGINGTSSAEAQSVKVWLDKHNDPAGKEIALALTIVTGFVMLFQIASMDVINAFMNQKESLKFMSQLYEVMQVRFLRQGVNCLAIVLWARLVMQSSSPWLNHVLAAVGCIVNKDAEQTISLLVWIGFLCTLLFEMLTNVIDINYIASKTQMKAPFSASARRFEVYERVA